MTESLRFVLDTNVLVEAHRRYYAFDIAPCFWRVLVELASKGHIISIDRVKDELMKSGQEDALNKWALSEFDHWFASTDKEEVFEAYREVINWAMGANQYYAYAKTEFADVADSWVVAFAKAYNYVVVTQEQYNRDAKRRILIPNACRAMGVKYMNTFEMLRKLNASLGE
ncbi:twitching motility protein PilT [Anoxybacillus sp. UARK-01]|uniref:DUF4411 family protein n=1 Tax=Anoxybacillus sp. UARK-01 TaxID=1895648 RepID=UPI0009BAD89A|nr:DUF4411 family protein [Anoxybacillus sp. UARK-01]OQM46676.1 twitching motility protein PilT [Anoxybacillus sp. UARK-01]